MTPQVFLAILFLSMTDPSVSVTKLIPMENISSCQVALGMFKRKFENGEVTQNILGQEMFIGRVSCLESGQEV